MFKKTATAAALAATAFLAATPALADGYRHSDRRAPERVVVVQRGYTPYYAQHRRFERRPVVVQRTVVQRPVIVHRHSHDVLGGLILGAVLGAVIANHAGY